MRRIAIDAGRPTLGPAPGGGGGLIVKIAVAAGLGVAGYFIYKKFIAPRLASAPATQGVPSLIAANPAQTSTLPSYLQPLVTSGVTALQQGITSLVPGTAAG